jgi:tripeptidyl-peptidase-1
MTIGLKQDRLDELISSLYQVSDPAHERYGAHLTKEQVDALAAPHPDSLALVEDWLSHHGVDTSTSITHFGGSSWLALDVPVSKAERMLDTTYNTYYNPSTDTYVVRTISYALPRILHGHVDVITPTTYFGNMHKMKTTSFLQPHVATDGDVGEFKLESDAAVPASCRTTITPSCLRALYKTANYVPASTSINKLGVAGYLSEFANRADLQTFFSKFRTDAAGGSYTTVQVNGGGDDQNNPGVEANLDIQYTEGISFPTPNIYYSTGGSPPFKPDSQTPADTNEPYLDWVTFILAQSTIPQTITTSYGDDEQTVPPEYAKKVCNLFAQFGARGSSLMFSSGDNGVGGGDCLTNDGTNKKRFQPAFPASCPFVTTVGGTVNINPEVGVRFSGGGFSNYFTQPPYQTAAVSEFLTGLGTQFDGLYNSAGRAYPDVAAQAQGFQVVIGGQVNSVAGTSASSPAFAAVVSLLNDYRLANGKPPLGFLNPLIYTKPTAFNDITSGSNPGCGTRGFTAGAGWDPVTGLGTPDFVKMQTLLC